MRSFSNSANKSSKTGKINYSASIYSVRRRKRNIDSAEKAKFRLTMINNERILEQPLQDKIMLKMGQMKGAKDKSQMFGGQSGNIHRVKTELSHRIHHNK